MFNHSECIVPQRNNANFMGDSFYNDSKNDNVLEDGIVPQEYFARVCDYNGDKYDSMNIGTKERN